MTVAILVFSSSSNNSSSPTPNNNNSSIQMSNNNSNFSSPGNNVSTSTTGEQSDSNSSSSSSVSNFIQLPILSLTIILAVAYIILVLVRRQFRTNKLNWFIMNVCFTSGFLSCIMLTRSILKITNTSSLIPCRIQGFLQAMPAYQMMYSHAVVAASRVLTIVHSSKHIFRSTTGICSFMGFGWLIALLFAVPYLIVDSFACSNSAQASFLPVYTLSTILIIPVMIVLICNLRIFLFVHRSSQRVHTEGRGNNVSQARDVRLIKTMIVTFTVFVVGWTPLFLEQTFSESFKISSTGNTIFQVLPPLSMLCDVILLMYTNQPIRLFLWQLIMRRCQVVPNNPLVNAVQTKAHIIHKH